MKIFDTLKRTILTEKSYRGIADNKYMFEVDGSASKGDIKKAIEELYGVSVVKINTLNYRGKKKARGAKRKMVKVGKMKKAIIEVKEGQTIKTFDEIFAATDNKS